MITGLKIKSAITYIKINTWFISSASLGFIFVSEIISHINNIGDKSIKTQNAPKKNIHAVNSNIASIVIYYYNIKL